jgi:hypothetical protein
MITEIWACLPIDGKMKEETLYAWTLAPEQVAEWKENAEAEDEPVEYVQFVRKSRLDLLQGAVEDVVCGRGMFGVDPAADLQWAIAHLGAALAALGVTADEARGSGMTEVRPNMGQIMAECDCQDGASCQIEGRCLAEGGPSCG